MNNKEIEKSIRKSFYSTTPDNLNTILENCDSTIERGTQMKTNKNPFMIKGLSFAAMAAVALFVLLPNSNDAQATITLDVNPSVELTVEGNKVIEMKSLNDDAREIIEEEKIKGLDLNESLDEIILELVKNDYLTNDKNAVLLSVESEDKDFEEKLEKQISTEVETILKENKIEGSILSQLVQVDEDIKNLALKNNISVSKAQLIMTMTKLNPLYNTDQLSNLSIRELMLLSQKQTNQSDQFHLTGTPSQNGYIGNQKALEIALNEVNMTKEAILNQEIELDYDNNTMIYEVEFTTKEKEVEVEIDALTGVVKDVDIEKNDGDDFEENQKPDFTLNIQPEQAKEIALKDAKLQATQVSNMDIDLEKDNGYVYYEVSFENGTQEFDYKIDASNGKVLAKDIEVDDQDDINDDADDNDDHDDINDDINDNDDQDDINDDINDNDDQDDINDDNDDQDDINDDNDDQDDINDDIDDNNDDQDND